MSSSDVEHQQINEEIQISVTNQNYKNRCFYLTVKVLFSTPGLVILVVIYSIVGALIFPLLEAPMESENALSISKSREDCLRELWIITERLNVLYERNWTLLVHEQLRRFEGTIVAATKGGFIETVGEKFPRWSFSEALLYSVTVITTIGHGNLTPRTSEGKIVTMLYALIGVPLMLMCLSSLGGLLADALSCSYGKLCRNRKSNNFTNEESQGSCPQYEETDCSVCKYDAVPKDNKHNTYQKYSSINDREDSCHLIRNSPIKTSLPSSPTLKKSYGCNQYNIKNNHHHKHNIIVEQTSSKLSPKHYIGPISTTGSHTYFPSSLSVGGGSGGGNGGGSGGSIMMHCQQHQNLQQKYSTVQLGSHLSNNERNNHLVVYHTATVHGLGRSKFIPKPMPPEINMLIAECELNNCQQENSCAKNDCNDDDEEDEDNRIQCSHDTPSRIPLISSKRPDPSSLDSELNDSTDRNNETNDEEDSNSITNQNSPQVPITIILIILISYIFLGTVIFSIWENWSMIDGAYFCFVTLSTIGFGDIIPKKTFRGPELQLFACCAYLMLGLVLVAMSFSLLETQLIWKCRRMAVRLKLAKD